MWIVWKNDDKLNSESENDNKLTLMQEDAAEHENETWKQKIKKEGYDMIKWEEAKAKQKHETKTER